MALHQVLPVSHRRPGGDVRAASAAHVCIQDGLLWMLLHKVVHLPAGVIVNHLPQPVRNVEVVSVENFANLAKLKLSLIHI